MKLILKNYKYGEIANKCEEIFKTSENGFRKVLKKCSEM